MIIKGQARGNGAQLAVHLSRIDQNEVVRVFEARGTVARDIAGALREMEAHAATVISRRSLYHASISPEPTRPLTDAQISIAVDHLERKLGLRGQPRLVVVHRKSGREHVHVVWSRVDAERGRVISDSWNYRRHEEASRELEAMFGHPRVRETRRHPYPRSGPRAVKDYELRQSERSGLSPHRVSADLRAIWRRSRSAAEFRSNLAAAGYSLARGDRRVFVVIDQAGEAHSLARRLGEPTDAVRAKMQDMRLAELPSVAEVREGIRGRTRQSRITAGFVVAKKEILPRVVPGRSASVETERRGAAASAANDVRSTRLTGRYRSIRAIVIAEFAARIAEAIRFTPREQLGAALNALMHERYAALAALTREQPLVMGRGRPRRAGRGRSRHLRFAIRWWSPRTGPRSGRSVRP
ncbi:relaxase/mobilization nuclease domain-containing protein [Rhodovulum sp. PH10]|uniref:relaxase/mobilization nuclease domain-containing protein n=1 Tax=Rhodovulum sp. PH10 TaxID=1187851 RepID=UPI0009FFCBE4|nr:relaxase/mobilization nuclease domain-containing protein [Rhodovulum sp. PH10]